MPEPTCNHKCKAPKGRKCAGISYIKQKLNVGTQDEPDHRPLRDLIDAAAANHGGQKQRGHCLADLPKGRFGRNYHFATKAKRDAFDAEAKAIHSSVKIAKCIPQKTLDRVAEKHELARGVKKGSFKVVRGEIVHL